MESESEGRYLDEADLMTPRMYVDLAEAAGLDWTLVSTDLGNGTYRHNIYPKARTMTPQELIDIKERRANRLAEPIPDYNPQAEEDLGMLIGEIERLKSNYQIAVDDLDGLMLHYRNVLPEQIRDTLDGTRERVRGLL